MNMKRIGNKMRSLTLTGSRMKEMANKSTSAEVVALSLSMRQRMRQVINLDRIRSELLRQGEDLNENDFMQYWRDLQAEGLGHIVHGRYGHDTTFLFQYDPRAIGKAAVEGVDHKAIPVTESRPRRRTNYRHGTMHQADRSYNQEFKMRTDGSRVSEEPRPTSKPFKLSIDVPSDLDEDSLKILLNTVKRLGSKVD